MFGWLRNKPRGNGLLLYVTSVQSTALGLASRRSDQQHKTSITSGISYNKIRFQLNPTPDKTANKLNLQQPKKNHIIFPAEGNKIGGNPASSMQSKLLLFDGINRNKGFGERPNALGSIANAQQTQQFVR